MTNEQLVARIQAGENVSENMSQLYDQVKDFIRSIAWKYRNGAELSSGGAWMSCRGSRAKSFGEDTRAGRHWRESGGRLGEQWNR